MTKLQRCDKGHGTLLAMRMANEERIRVCTSPVARFACAEGVRLADEQREELSRSESRKSPSRQVRGDGQSLSSFAMSRKSFQVVAAYAAVNLESC